MSFEAFKKEVFRLAGNRVHLLPDSNTLFVLWEQGWSPIDVVHRYCS